MHIPLISCLKHYDSSKKIFVQFSILRWFYCATVLKVIYLTAISTSGILSHIKIKLIFESDKT